MRLTLRTLLAFLDSTLDRKDAEELAKKVDESDTARKLMARIRDVVHRLRLGAASVDDHAQELDPNTVAEYLDSELGKDRVPDFEKVCLDSDVQLAEVASCHQILTMILGEPAEIDPKSRERMYEVPKQLSAEAVAEAILLSPFPEGSAASGDDDPSRQVRTKPSVPDYLRDPAPRSSRLLPAMAAILLTAIILVLLLGATGQFESIIRLFGVKNEEVAESAESKHLAQPPADGPTKKEDPAATSDPTSPPTPAAAKTPSSMAPGTPAPSTKGPDPALEASSPAPAAKPPSPPAATPGPAAAPAGDAATPPGKPTTDTPKMAMNVPGTGKPTPAAETAPLPPEQIGRLVSPKQVLLQYDAAAGEWNRLRLQAAMNPGTPILSLPACQPSISMSVPITVELIGGSQLEFLSTDPQNIPGIKAVFGRLVLRAVGNTRPRLRVQLGGRTGVITLENADSIVAMDVFRDRRLGADPEREPGPLKADLYAVSGGFAWFEDTTRPQLTVNAPAQLRIDDLPLGAPISPVPIPAWVNPDDPSLRDHMAAPIIEQSMLLGRSVLQSLLELAGSTRREVASLAIRSLGYIGNFEPLVDTLSSADHRAAWDEHIDQLRAAIARGPETAGKVRQAFEARYGAESAILFRLLWGCREADLRNGTGVLLAEHLDHESLAVRVLAIYNLALLKGGAKYSYKPYDPPSKRQAAVTRWKKEMATANTPPSGGGSVEPKKAAVAPPQPSAPEPTPSSAPVLLPPPPAPLLPPK